MRISVVVPFHNAEPYLEKCINALRDQTLPDDRYEIMMVDNNSTDRSAEIAARHPRVKLLSEDRRGAYVARNLAVRSAAGDVVAFTDASCVASSDWLERIAEAMRSSDRALIQGQRDFGGDSFALSVLAVYEMEKARYVFSRSDQRTYYACMANLAVRRSVLDEVGPFVEMSRGSDVVFVQRVIDRYGLGVISYQPEVRVRDLEVSSMAVWCRKLFTYGRSHANYRKLVSVRPLGAPDRTRVYHRAMQRGGRPSVRSVLSLPVLILGATCYDLGRCLPLSDG